jgi:hypothetical protein
MQVQFLHSCLRFVNNTFRICNNIQLLRLRVQRLNVAKKESATSVETDNRPEGRKQT